MRLIDQITKLYHQLDNPWLCADDVRDELKKRDVFAKTESVSRRIRQHRPLFEEMKCGNYKKFRLKPKVANSRDIKVEGSYDGKNWHEIKDFPLGKINTDCLQFVRTPKGIINVKYFKEFCL